MDARGLLGDEQRRADLAVRVALGDQREDRVLALGEPQAVDRGVLGCGVRRWRPASRGPAARALRPRHRATAPAGSRRCRRPAQGVRGAGALPAAEDQRLALPPAGVSELDGRPRCRETLRRRRPCVGVGLPVGARELCDAQRLERDYLRARRAVVPAVGRQEGAEALERRSSVALGLTGAPLVAERQRAQCARGGGELATRPSTVFLVDGLAVLRALRPRRGGSAPRRRVVRRGARGTGRCAMHEQAHRRRSRRRSRCAPTVRRAGRPRRSSRRLERADAVFVAADVRRARDDDEDSCA